ncbi:hypothetical protein [Nitrolancea hollandica]|uniref:Type I restriction enzyme R protein N-terminal domain-containing protein n=1 Tax=Nitrolancea hollandica Lb TaxID=1129897 RepID=I4EHP9_9BACT|nr:hypothetical protein [Nitrolancea hollandica]CCF84211.1 hypothetical protein NITHO_3210019 [Nitrolancea hollandica Lb]
MSSTIADLVLLQDGHPVVVVEAKPRPIPPDFERAVRAQVRMFAGQTGSQWSILADPVTTMIFQGEHTNEPLATIPTKEIIESADLHLEIVGERLLLIAIRRWLRSLPQEEQFLKRFPELAGFVQTVRHGDEFASDYPVD